jgi:hypothetical protein
MSMSVVSGPVSLTGATRAGGAVGIEGAEDHIVGVEILGNAQHRGAGEFGRGGQAVALEFAGATCVGIDLFASVGQILDGEFFEALAEPIEAGRRAVVFKRENEVETLLGARGALRVLRADARWEERDSTRKRDGQSAGDAMAH